MFPARRFGGGALAVYLDGQPVVDVWTGWSDRGGKLPWTADTAPMVFSATKGMASTVIHRLADRGLIDYDAPVAEYWPEFGGQRQVGPHRSRGDEAPRRPVGSARRHKGRLAGSRRDGRTARRGASGTSAGQTGLPRADLRLADVRAGPGRDRKGYACADPRGARRAVGHRRHASGPAARRSADAGRRDHHAAEHRGQSGRQLCDAQGRPSSCPVDSAPCTSRA